MKRIILCLSLCLLLFGCRAKSEVPVQPETRENAAPQASAPVEPPLKRAQEDRLPVGEPVQTEKPPQGEAPVSDNAQQTPAPGPAAIEAHFLGKFSEAPQLSERSYQSSSVDITITTYTVKDTYSKLTTYHVADIYVKDATSIRTAPGRSFDTRYERTVKDIAADAGALLAIDGDTYTHAKQSFIIRNGVLYRDKPIEGTDICILYRDGRMETKKAGTFTVEEVVAADPWQVWGFGPALLDEDGHAMEITHKLASWNPRAAIGYYEPGHYCFVIVDGRDHEWSEGVKLSALSRLMEDLGCKVAYNLDGGDSAQMYWNGEIISKSCNENRVVSDIIYILPEE